MIPLICLPAEADEEITTSELLLTGSSSEKKALNLRAGGEIEKLICNIHSGQMTLKSKTAEPRKEHYIDFIYWEEVSDLLIK